MNKLLNIFFRSFMLQALWNYETMQTLGFLYTLYPSFKDIYEDRDQLRDVFERHMNYFNTHPYMAHFVMGEVLRLEEENAAGKDKEDSIIMMKKQLGGPLAALGDKIFWSTWRPLTGLLGVAAVILIYKGIINIPGWVIPVGFILMFNIPVVYFKIRALKSSYTGRSQIAYTLKKINRNPIIKFLPILGLTIISLILIMSLFIYENNIYGYSLLAGTAFVVFSRTLAGVSATRLVYLISLIVITGNLIWSLIG